MSHHLRRITADASDGNIWVLLQVSDMIAAVCLWRSSWLDRQFETGVKMLRLSASHILQQSTFHTSGVQRWCVALLCEVLHSYTINSTSFLPVTSRHKAPIILRVHRSPLRPPLMNGLHKSDVPSQQTAKLQLARQRAQDHPEDEDCQEQIQEIKHE